MSSRDQAFISSDIGFHHPFHFHKVESVFTNQFKSQGSCMITPKYQIELVSTKVLNFIISLQIQMELKSRKIFNLNTKSVAFRHLALVDLQFTV